MGFDVKVLLKNSIVEIKLAGNKYWFYLTSTPFNLHSSLALNYNKYKTIQLLKRSQVPTGVTCFTAHDFYHTQEKFSDLHYPLTLRSPKRFLRKHNIRFNITDIDILFDDLKSFFDRFEIVMIEPFNPKLTLYRALVFYGNIISLLELTPPKITGDGVTTIEQLIRIKNAYIKEKAYIAKLAPIIEECETYYDSMGKRNLDPLAVLETGETIAIGDHSCPYQGGDTKSLPINSMPKKTRDQILHLSHFTDLNFMAVDFVCHKLDKPIDGKNGYFTDMIGDPDISIYENPYEGEKTLVARMLMTKLITLDR